MNRCHLCREKGLRELLDLGMQAICNRFLTDPGNKEYTHPMIIAQCNACGVVQIKSPVPASELLPHYDWITYNEPEGHLDDLTETILALPGLTSESTICGVSFKDDSMLARFKKRGFQHTWRIKPETDLGITDKKAGVETIQDCLRPEATKSLADKYGTADLVIARHILEHAHDAFSFMRSLKHLVKPEGYIVFEVPDCTRALENCDYATLWEEHILYFTPETFKRCFAYGGFSLSHFKCYPYPFENSLVGIVKAAERRVMPSFSSEDVSGSERHRAKIFAEKFPKYAGKVKKFFSKYRQGKSKIALFGAGHLACTFINLLDLKDFIDFCVDDNPNKLGLFLPGSRIPIYASPALIKENIKLCLLSLNPLNEDKVVQVNQNFLAGGGAFLSIFPTSKRALGV